MQLIIILLTTVAILTFLSGLVTFCGAKKGDRVRSAWFFAAAFFATTWMASISVFLTAGPEKFNVIEWHINWVFISAILLDAAFLGYVSWKEKYGKVLTAFFLIFGLIISSLIFIPPNTMYSNVVLSSAGNSMDINVGPLYITYIAYFCLIVPVIVFTLLSQYSKTRSTRKKGGDLTIMISFAISSVLIVLSEVILPLLGNWSLAWLGPLALSATIIGFYYTILRYRALNLSSLWLKIFSYIIILTSVAIVYMVIFAMIFAALFKGSTPSTEVIVLNFIMIIIFLLLMPAINQLTGFIRTLIVNHGSEHK